MRTKTFLFEPLPMVRKFARTIADAAADAPILDVACGTGRNGMYLAQLGCTVLCVDKDLSRFERAQQQAPAVVQDHLKATSFNFATDKWPYGRSSLGGIIDVHFFLPALFPAFRNSLMPGGYLLFETPPGCGGNYRDLPKVGEVKEALKSAFYLELYKERRVGPSGCDAVGVQAVAKRIPWNGI